jgi:hypothetical protein
MDPQAQYFSPYVYGGNSPISGTDPDGELFFLIAVVTLAVVGAYVGGAQKNKSWNPVKWNWKDPGTYLSMAGGAIGSLKYFMNLFSF